MGKVILHLYMGEHEPTPELAERLARAVVRDCGGDVDILGWRYLGATLEIKLRHKSFTEGQECAHIPCVTMLWLDSHFGMEVLALNRNSMHAWRQITGEKIVQAIRDKYEGPAKNPERIRRAADELQNGGGRLLDDVISDLGICTPDHIAEPG
jgi:hypothetical protein